MTDTSSDSLSRFTVFARGITRNSINFLPGLLAFARLLFSSAILYSIVSWNDEQWTSAHLSALILLVWAIIALTVTLTGTIKWKIGGRLVILIDVAFCAATIILLPTYSLAAAMLAILTSVFLIMRYDGRVALLFATLPLIAVLARTQLDLMFHLATWPASSEGMRDLADLVAFLIALMVVTVAIPSSVRLNMIGRQLYFNQFTDDVVTEYPEEHVIDPVLNQLSELYPRGKVFCIVDSRRKKNRISVVGGDLSVETDPRSAKELLDLFGNLQKQPMLFDIKSSRIVDVHSRKATFLEPDPAERLFRRFGIEHGAIIDFQTGRSRGRLFFATATRIDEALLKEVSILSRKQDRYFNNVTDWYEKKRSLITHARELARRDLHDGVLQSLAALKMRLVTQVSGNGLENHPGTPVLRKTIDIITLEQARLRALLHTDGEIDSPVDLVETLALCLKTLALQWEVVAELDSREPALPVDRESAENIEHLVREAIANAIRHAQARHLVVSMALGEHDLMISLQERDAPKERSEQTIKKASAAMQSRSLMQRLTLVNGSAYSEGTSDGALLAVRIPMDFLVDV